MYRAKQLTKYDIVSMESPLVFFFLVQNCVKVIPNAINQKLHYVKLMFTSVTLMGHALTHTCI